MDGRKIITAGLIPVLTVMCGMPGLCAQLSPAGSCMDSSADMLCVASHMESPLPQPRAVTLRDKVMQVRETYGVKFVYDSTIDLDLPYTGGPAGEGEGLEEALDRIFGGSGIEWRRRRGHIVLVHGEPRELRDSIGTAGPENQAVERRDTITESRISTDRYRREINRTQTGLEHIDGRKFNNGFAFLSSPDVIKALQNLPGVASGTELLSGLYVHGGTGSDNLFLLDGVPLYNVSHLAGLFSSFNTDVVESLDFYKSGFPARYGGRLSSVVDVKTRDGDFEDYHGVFSIGLIDGRLQYEGPIVKGKTSFNVAMRRTWMDLVTVPIFAILDARDSAGTNTGFRYAFTDMNGSVTHIFSPDSRLSFDVYYGTDILKLDRILDSYDVSSDTRDRMRINTRWGNVAASLDWDRRISDRLHSDVKAYFTRYASRTGVSGVSDDAEPENVIEENTVSKVSDIGLKADFDWNPVPAHHVRFGASYCYHLYNPEREHVGPAQSGTAGEMGGLHLRYYGHEPSLYIEDEMTLASWFSAGIGLRYVLFGVEGKVRHAVEPRAALRFQLAPQAVFKVSYTEMNQFSHQVSSIYIDLPTSSWMPSTAEISPMHSRQLAVGLYLTLPHNIKVNAEGFYKTMSHLREYSGPSSVFPPLDDWEESFSEGRGKAYGAEIEAMWSNGKLDISAYYTLSWSLRRFDDFYRGWYPDRNDNRHKFTIEAAWRFNSRIDMYAAWNYHTGNRITVPTHRIDYESDVVMIDGHPSFSGGDMFLFSSPYNAKLPDYHRLDVGVNFRKKTRRGNERIWNLSVYNLYCRPNAIYGSANPHYGGGKDAGYATGMIPIIPTFSYILKF